MEMVLYLFGNCLCNCAVLIPLMDRYRHENKFWDPADWDPVSQDKLTPTPFYGLISKDLQIMCFISSIIRVYWSCVPPVVWEGEEGILSYITMVDVFLTPLVWGWLLSSIGMVQERSRRVLYADSGALVSRRELEKAKAELERAKNDADGMGEDLYQDQHRDCCEKDMRDAGVGLQTVKDATSDGKNDGSSEASSVSKDNQKSGYAIAIDDGWHSREGPRLRAARLHFDTHEHVAMLNHAIDEGNLNGRKVITRPLPWFTSWMYLIPAGVILGTFLHVVLPDRDESEYPFAQMLMVANITIDALAFIPQTYETLNSGASREVSQFMGMLSMGRLFRLIFWLTVILQQYMAEGVLGENWFMLKFVIPDCVQLLFLVDYLYLWLKTVRREDVFDVFSLLSGKCDFIYSQISGRCSE